MNEVDGQKLEPQIDPTQHGEFDYQFRFLFHQLKLNISKAKKILRKKKKKLQQNLMNEEKEEMQNNGFT